jgi:hypothetical protein
MVVYLDDILIFNQSWEEHLHHIRQVLQTLRQHKLCANLEKCTFGMTQVQYLGYIIDEQGCACGPNQDTSHSGLANPNHSNKAPQLSGSCQFLPQVHVGVLSYHLAFESSHQGRSERKVFWSESQQKEFSKLKHHLFLCTSAHITRPATTI